MEVQQLRSPGKCFVAVAERHLTGGHLARSSHRRQGQPAWMLWRFGASSDLARVQTRCAERTVPNKRWSSD